MKAVDLLIGVLKGWDWGMKDIWDVRVHLDYDSFEDWQLETLATALATISTYTAQEALAELESALRELKNSDGACAQVFETKLKDSEARYIVASDLAKLRIARAAIADTMPKCWTDLPTYKLERMQSIALMQLSTLTAEAERVVSKQHEEEHDEQDTT